jgi:acetyl esterase/lipase
MPFGLLIALCCLLQFSAAIAADAQKDVEYATVGTNSLKLDIYRSDTQAGPLIVWIHGGAWRSGSKSSMPLTELVRAGYTIASVDYRLSTDAKFPAQIHDIKAAIRFLRAKQKELGVDASRIVVAGDSAGGHLAALVGVTNASEEHEGSVGSHRSADSRVQGIISFYGQPISRPY